MEDYGRELWFRGKFAGVTAPPFASLYPCPVGGACPPVTICIIPLFTVDINVLLW